MFTGKSELPINPILQKQTAKLTSLVTTWTTFFAWAVSSLLARLLLLYPSSSELATRYNRRAFSHKASECKGSISSAAGSLLYTAYLLLLISRLLLLSFRPHHWITTDYDLLMGRLAAYASHRMVGLAMVPLVGAILFYHLHLHYRRPLKAVAVMLWELLVLLNSSADKGISKTLHLLAEEVVDLATAILLKAVCQNQWFSAFSITCSSRDGGQELSVARVRLRHFNGLSQLARQKVALFERHSELVLALGIPVATAIMAAILGKTLVEFSFSIATTTTTPTTTTTTTAKCLLFLLETPLLVATAHRALTDALFLTKAVLTTSFALRLQLAELNRRLLSRVMFAKLKFSSCSKGRQPQKQLFHLLTAWTAFRADHSHVLVDLLHLNRFFSPAIAWGYVVHLLLNVYFLSLLTFLRLDWLPTLFVLWILLFQLLFAAFLFLLPSVAAPLYQLHRLLYRSLAEMENNVGGGYQQVKQKIKLTAYYELLCSRKPLLLLYSSMLFYSFTIFIKNRRKQLLMANEYKNNTKARKSTPKTTLKKL
ncbi:hypothetical protein TYRP_022146 [Tyrophagus putrescentiae]|nr:hypothetical protein TYRP_022146 [Tyrophagus putrescentiae]